MTGSKDRDSDQEPARPGVEAGEEGETPSSPFADTLAAPSASAGGLDVVAAGGLDQLMTLLAKPPPTRLIRERRIARGGMGIVELVHEQALDRRLARKVVLPRLRGDSRVVQALVREAQVTGQLDHPGIVPVHELGFDDREGWYFTMKRVEGLTFDRYVESRATEAVHDRLMDIVDVVVRICDALSFAHSRGIVHCDIKPANVMVGDYGQVYLMDWGLACGLVRDPGDAWRAKPTRDVAIGTPAFMAPEQATGGEIDHRTDVFGVGSLLYFAVSGRSPYDGESALETLDRARRRDLVPLPSVAGIPLPEALSRIVMKAMAADPAGRYQTAAELREELIRFQRGGAAFPRRRVFAGEMIMREGETGEELYVLISGRALAFRTVGGERISLGVIEAGEVIGELAILTDTKRTASVEAIVDCTLLVITPDALERELSGMQSWMAALTRSLARRFREREERLQKPPGGSETTTS